MWSARKSRPPASVRWSAWLGLGRGIKQHRALALDDGTVWRVQSDGPDLADEIWSRGTSRYVNTTAIGEGKDRIWRRAAYIQIGLAEDTANILVGAGEWKRT